METRRRLIKVKQLEMFGKYLFLCSREIFIIFWGLQSEFIKLETQSRESSRFHDTMLWHAPHPTQTRKFSFTAILIM